MSEIFLIRLRELREKRGLSQSDVAGFTQSNVSRLESRDDMKLSTLIEYLQSIGMAVEITVSDQSTAIPIKLLKAG